MPQLTPTAEGTRVEQELDLAAEIEELGLLGGPDSPRDASAPLPPMLQDEGGMAPVSHRCRRARTPNRTTGAVLGPSAEFWDRAIRLLHRATRVHMVRDSAP